MGQIPYSSGPAREPSEQAPIAPPPLPPFDPTPYAPQTDYSVLPAVQHPGQLAPVSYQIDPRTGLPFDPHFVRDLATRGRGAGQSAAFFPRLGALLVDYCILSVLWFFLIGFAAFIDSAALGLLATFIGPALYFIAFWATSGRTPGYRAAGLHLIHTDGSKVGVGASIVRYIGSMISWPLFCLGYLWMLWDPAGQTWHDKMADTTVVQS